MNKTFYEITKDITIPTPRNKERELTICVTPHKVRRIVSVFIDSLNCVCQVKSA